MMLVAVIVTLVSSLFGAAGHCFSIAFSLFRRASSFRFVLREEGVPYTKDTSRRKSGDFAVDREISLSLDSNFSQA